MRSRRADVLVLIGICTHLGCLPKQFFDAGDPVLGADWPGAFAARAMARASIWPAAYSRARRLRPTWWCAYTFSGQNTLVIGADDAAKKGAA